MTAIKSLIALLLGGLTGGVVYWVIAVVLLLSMHGIPMGSAGGPPTRTDFTVLLVGAMLAGVAAGMVTARLAPARAHALVVLLAISLAIFAYLGFSNPGANWPRWFAATFALAVTAGVITGGLFLCKRSLR